MQSVNPIQLANIKRIQDALHNGRLVWKDKDGNTLDSVYRKQL